MHIHKYLATEADIDNLAVLLAGARPSDVWGFDVESSGPSIRKSGAGKRTSPDPYRHTVTGFSLAYHNDVASVACCYIPTRHKDLASPSFPSAITRLFPLIAAAAARGVRLWAHDWQYELQLMRNEGVVIEDSGHLHDSMVAAWLAGWATCRKTWTKLELGLKPLRARVLGAERATFEDIAKGRQVEDVPVSEIWEYAALDAADTLIVGERALADLTSQGLLGHFHDIDMPFVEVARAMSAAGTLVDVGPLNALETKLTQEAAEIKVRFEALTRCTVMEPVKVWRQAVHPDGTPAFLKKRGPATPEHPKGAPLPKMIRAKEMQPVVRGADIASDGEVSRWCYELLTVWPQPVQPNGKATPRNANGVFPVDKDALLYVAAHAGTRGRELVHMRLRYSACTKLVSTYIRPLRDLPPQYGDGRLHARFKQTGTDTGRLSSSDPNLQNIPARTEEGKAIAAALKPAVGWARVVRDLSQAELRLAAHFSKDPELSLCYLLGDDVHKGTLEKLHALGWPEADRTAAKIVNFSSLYLISANSLAPKMRTDIAKAELALKAFYERFERIMPLHEWCFDFVAQHGYMKTLDGFRRPLNPAMQRSWKTKKMELNAASQRQALNVAIQGSVGGHMKRCMVELGRRWRGLDDRHMVNQIHDALYVDCRLDVVDEVAEEMRQVLECWPGLRVPMLTDLKVIYS